MKAALCLSGHMRTYKDTASSLMKNIISPLSCDVFIHTWDIRDHTPHGYYEDKKDDDFAQLEEIFNPKRIVIQNQEEITNDLIKPLIAKYSLRGAFHNKPEGVLCMYYKRREVFNLLKETGESYDLIISTRPDILCSKQSLSDVGPLTYGDFNMERLNIPPSDGMRLNCTEHKPSGRLIGGYGSFGGCTDIFAAGNEKGISVFSTVYDHIVDYVLRGCPLQAERLLITHFMCNNLEVSEIDANFGILREKKYEDR